MIHGDLNDRDTYAHLLSHPVWDEVFQWLDALVPFPELGIEQLRGDDLYVNIMTYPTKPRSECRFESHRQYVDLQYTIDGAEIIDWHPAAKLSEETPYDSTKDVTFYHDAPAISSLLNTRGRFAIFYPSDAHRPMVANPSDPSVLKLVVKIRLSLIA